MGPWVLINQGWYKYPADLARNSGPQADEGVPRGAHRQHHALQVFCDGAVVRLSVAAGEAVGELGAEGVFEEGAFLAEFVLEDHAAEDDGDGGCELADEAEGCGGEGDVVAFDV